MNVFSFILKERLDYAAYKMDRIEKAKHAIEAAEIQQKIFEKTPDRKPSRHRKSKKKSQKKAHSTEVYF